jgi:hypothetical protein
MGRDDIRTIGVTIRGGWEQSPTGTYDFVWDDRVRGFICHTYDGSGWMGGVFTAGATDPNERGIPTIEEAMLWVEMTYALATD